MSNKWISLLDRKAMCSWDICALVLSVIPTKFANAYVIYFVLRNMRSERFHLEQLSSELEITLSKNFVTLKKVYSVSGQFFLHSFYPLLEESKWVLKVLWSREGVGEGAVENCFWRREGLDGKGLVNFWRGMIQGFSRYLKIFFDIFRD